MERTFRLMILMQYRVNTGERFPRQNITRCLYSMTADGRHQMGRDYSMAFLFASLKLKKVISGRVTYFVHLFGGFYPLSLDSELRFGFPKYQVT